MTAPDIPSRLPPLLTTEPPPMPLARWLAWAVAVGRLTPAAAEQLAGPVCPTHNLPILARDGDQQAWCRACMELDSTEQETTYDHRN